MTTASRVATNTTAFPVYDDKDDLLADLLNAVEGEVDDQDSLQHILNRLSNTNTSTWSTPTARHDTNPPPGRL